MVSTNPDALVIPIAATTERGGETSVFVVRDGVATKTTVELGIVEEPLVEVLSGLDASQIIIADPADDIEDGAKVKPTGLPQPVDAPSSPSAPQPADGAG